MFIVFYLHINKKNISFHDSWIICKLFTYTAMKEWNSLEFTLGTTLSPWNLSRDKFKCEWRLCCGKQTQAPGIIRP